MVTVVPDTQTAERSRGTTFASGNPYVELFWDMIRSAKAAKASDIHVQPEAKGLNIRFRVHGEMQTWMAVEDQHKVTLLQEVKRLTNCDLGKSQEPDDTRLSVPSMKLEIRNNLVPTLNGDKFVMRLLDQTKQFSLARLGLPDIAIHALENALRISHGVNLLTGPTGSGKTTTLYAALTALNTQGMNIVTIEDPVEYTFPGISQIGVSKKLSFSGALRAVLRQDPDVILVGEIRDQETAALCFQAAATGHLVLSTLHANSAADIERRLSALGIPQDQVRSCLKFKSAQRLIQKLCPDCRLPMDLVDLATRSQGNPLCAGVAATKEYRKRNHDGCESCRQSLTPGIVGEVPLFEFITADASNGEGEARSTTLGEAAMQLAVKGEVDIYDALQMA